MQVFHERFKGPLVGQPHVVAVGNFDGIHLGHQALLKRMLADAAQWGIPSAVLTFFPHPAEFLRPAKLRDRLFTTEEKLSVFEQMGVDVVWVAPFDKELSSLSPTDFFRSFLLSGLMARSVTVGHDFRFGKDRAGNIETLKQLGKEASVPVNVVEPISNRDERVSSTRIRTLLRDGDLEAANELLGRPYFVSGNVTSGDNRGEGLGFPTANIATAHDKALPKNGVYVTRATWQKQFFSAVCNVGVRPTFNEGESERRLEVHFLDFSNQIYSEWVKVEFLERIRDEKKFASREELVKQIQSDVAYARDSFARNG